VSGTPFPVDDVAVDPQPVDQPEPPAQQRTDPERPLRSVVIVNPVRVTDLADRRAAVDRALAPAAWVETTAEDPGVGQTRQAVADGAEVIFACGGDGTVRAVLEGLVHATTAETGGRRPAEDGPALAVLPAGTGNLLAANLGLPDDPAEGVRVAVERGRRRIDVGEVADAAPDGSSAMFAVMAGMGFDAHLLADAPADLKARIGWPAYVISGLKHLRDRPMRLVVAIDDDPPFRRTARSVVIGNVGRLQGGLRLLPDAEPDSGTFDVAVLEPRTLRHWAGLALGVLLRKRRVQGRQVLRGRTIVVTTDRPQPREVDGDVLPDSRTLRVTIRPGALWLCVYQPDDSPDLTDRG
jgi:diacylglycerol kinase family enzyme